MTLSKYPPTFFGICHNAIEASKKIVKGWLQRSMLEGHSGEEIDNTVDYLSDYHSHLQHNMRLAADELRKHTALNITNLEDDQELQGMYFHCIIAIK